MPLLYELSHDNHLLVVGYPGYNWWYSCGVNWTGAWNGWYYRILYIQLWAWSSLLKFPNWTVWSSAAEICQMLASSSLDCPWLACCRVSDKGKYQNFLLVLLGRLLRSTHAWKKAINRLKINLGVLWKRYKSIKLISTCCLFGKYLPGWVPSCKEHVF